MRASVTETIRRVMSTADDPRVVAEVVLRAANATRPQLRYTAGGLAGRLRLLRRFAPWLDGGIRKDLRLDLPPAADRLLSPSS